MAEKAVDPSLAQLRRWWQEKEGGISSSHQLQVHQRAVAAFQKRTTVGASSDIDIGTESLSDDDVLVWSWQQIVAAATHTTSPVDANASDKTHARLTQAWYSTVSALTGSRGHSHSEAGSKNSRDNIKHKDNAWAVWLTVPKAVRAEFQTSAGCSFAELQLLAACKLLQSAPSTGGSCASASAGGGFTTVGRRLRELTRSFRAQWSEEGKTKGKQLLRPAALWSALFRLANFEAGTRRAPAEKEVTSTSAALGWEPGEDLWFACCYAVYDEQSCEKTACVIARLTLSTWWRSSSSPVVANYVRDAVSAVRKTEHRQQSAGDVSREATAPAAACICRATAISDYSLRICLAFDPDILGTALTAILEAEEVEENAEKTLSADSHSLKLLETFVWLTCAERAKFWPSAAAVIRDDPQLPQEACFSAFTGDAFWRSLQKYRSRIGKLRRNFDAAVALLHLASAVQQHPDDNGAVKVNNGSQSRASAVSNLLACAAFDVPTSLHDVYGGTSSEGRDGQRHVGLLRKIVGTFCSQAESHEGRTWAFAFQRVISLTTTFGAAGCSDTPSSAAALWPLAISLLRCYVSQFDAPPPRADAPPPRASDRVEFERRQYAKLEPALSDAAALAFEALTHADVGAAGPEEDEAMSCIESVASKYCERAYRRNDASKGLTLARAVLTRELKNKKMRAEDGPRDGSEGGSWQALARSLMAPDDQAEIIATNKDPPEQVERVAPPGGAANRKPNKHTHDTHTYAFPVVYDVLRAHASLSLLADPPAGDLGVEFVRHFAARECCRALGSAIASAEHVGTDHEEGSSCAGASCAVLDLLTTVLAVGWAKEDREAVTLVATRIAEGVLMLRGSKSGRAGANTKERTGAALLLVRLGNYAHVWSDVFSIWGGISSCEEFSAALQDACGEVSAAPFVGDEHGQPQRTTTLISTEVSAVEVAALGKELLFAGQATLGAAALFIAHRLEARKQADSSATDCLASWLYLLQCLRELLHQEETKARRGLFGNAETGTSPLQEVSVVETVRRILWPRPAVGARGELGGQQQLRGALQLLLTSELSVKKARNDVEQEDYKCLSSGGSPVWDEETKHTIVQRHGLRAALLCCLAGSCDDSCATVLPSLWKQHNADLQCIFAQHTCSASGRAGMKDNEPPVDAGVIRWQKFTTAEIWFSLARVLRRSRFAAAHALRLSAVRGFSEAVSPSSAASHLQSRAEAHFLLDNQLHYAESAHLGCALYWEVADGYLRSGLVRWAKFWFEHGRKFAGSFAVARPRGRSLHGETKNRSDSPPATTSWYDRFKRAVSDCEKAETASANEKENNTPPVDVGDSQNAEVGVLAAVQLQSTPAFASELSAWLVEARRRLYWYCSSSSAEEEAGGEIANFGTRDATGGPPARAKIAAIGSCDNLASSTSFCAAGDMLLESLLAAIRNSDAVAIKASAKSLTHLLFEATEKISVSSLIQDRQIRGLIGVLAPYCAASWGSTVLHDVRKYQRELAPYLQLYDSERTRRSGVFVEQEVDDPLVVKSGKIVPQQMSWKHLEGLFFSRRGRSRAGVLGDIARDARSKRRIAATPAAPFVSIFVHVGSQQRRETLYLTRVEKNPNDAVDDTVYCHRIQGTDLVRRVAQLAAVLEENRKSVKAVQKTLCSAQVEEEAKKHFWEERRKFDNHVKDWLEETDEAIFGRGDTDRNARQEAADAIFRQDASHGVLHLYLDASLSNAPLEHLPSLKAKRITRAIAPNVLLDALASATSSTVTSRAGAAADSGARGIPRSTFSWSKSSAAPPPAEQDDGTKKSVLASSHFSMKLKRSSAMCDPDEPDRGREKMRSAAPARSCSRAPCVGTPAKLRKRNGGEEEDEDSPLKPLAMNVDPDSTAELPQEQELNKPGSSSSGFYVLNPKNDAEVHDKSLLPVLKRLKWHGVVGKVPSKKKLFELLCERETFLFSGHYGGEEFVNCEQVEMGGRGTFRSGGAGWEAGSGSSSCSRSSANGRSCIAASFLMGCGSTKSFGLASSYLAGGHGSGVGAGGATTSGNLFYPDGRGATQNHDRGTTRIESAVATSGTTDVPSAGAAAGQLDSTCCAHLHHSNASADDHTASSAAGHPSSSHLPVDAFGTHCHYLIGGSPFVVGCLWEVLSGEVDKFTANVLEGYVQVEETESSLLACLAAAREKCRLPYLTGCAVVHYGVS